MPPAAPAPAPIHRAPEPGTPQILIYGNPCDGLQFAGPFADAEEAAEYATDHSDIRDNDWWTADLNPPTGL